jgi:uncharacterized membrane protein
MIQWLRRRFLAGFFVTVPLVVSVAAIVWIFRLVDGTLGPWYAEWLGRDIPGLGLLTTVLLVLVVGTVATNVIGKRVLQRAEEYLLRVPVFRTIYAPVKQLVVAFSPDNEYGFKRVVLVQDPSRGRLLGFLTREFTMEEGSVTKPMVAVYVPTNHLYLGDILVIEREQASFPDITVEEAIRIFLTGGMALSQRIRVGHGADRAGEFRI